MPGGIKITHEGRELTLTDLSRLTGIGYATLSWRWHAGDRDFASLTRPPHKGRMRAGRRRFMR